MAWHHNRQAEDPQPPRHVRCGCFSCQPRWLQPLANKFTYLLVYCACGLIQGMWFTYFVSILSTVEKTFKFPSSVSGIILAGNDVAQIIFSVCISYYGNKGNRPRWVGAGVLMNALGCVLSALPHFVWGPDTEDITDALRASNFNISSASDQSRLNATLCVASSLNHSSSSNSDNQQVCGSTDMSLTPVVLLFVSQFVSGIGTTCYYTLGMTYLDDSVDKEHSPIMFAISSGLRVMGPMLGFLLGSFSLSRFVVPGLNIQLSQKDPRWIGAWWLGFFVLASLLVVVGMLMCFFPKVLPERHQKHQQQQLQHQQRQLNRTTPPLRLDSIMSSKEDIHGAVQPPQYNNSGLLVTLKRLMTNTLLVTLLVNVVFAVMGFIGYFTFLPKYQQAAFNQSASTASLYSGLSGVLVTLVGYILSGVVMKVFQPRALYVTSYGAIITGVQVLCMAALMTIKCQQPALHGTVHEQHGFSLSEACNADCGCGTFRSMAPVCGHDGLTSFFSPCYAGCLTFSQDNGTTVFENCSCVSNHSSAGVPVSAAGANLMGSVSSATDGFCPVACSSFTTYIIILALMKFLGSTNRTGGMLVFFRSVSDQDKSVAMGMSTALLSIFCFIPAPIMFGAIVDSTCQIWEQKPCGGTGSCLLYDVDKLRIYLHSATLVAFGISFLLDLVVIYLARNIDLYGETKQQQNHGNTVVSEEDHHQLEPLTSSNPSGQ